MHSFTDDRGTDWDFRLTVGVARKVKSRLNVDLLASDWQKSYMELLVDADKRYSMMYLILDGKFDQEFFEDAISGKCLVEAETAFWAEVDFFILSLNPAAAEAMATVQATWAEERKRGSEAMVRLMTSTAFRDTVQRHQDQRERQIESLIGDFATKSAEQLESILQDSHSGN